VQARTKSSSSRNPTPTPANESRRNRLADTQWAPNVVPILIETDKRDRHVRQATGGTALVAGNTQCAAPFARQPPEGGYSMGKIVLGVLLCIPSISAQASNPQTLKDQY
jgi:hypothetical protein